MVAQPLAGGLRTIEGTQRVDSRPSPRGSQTTRLRDAQAAEPWSLTSLREKLIKIGAKVVSHGRYVTFQMAEVAVSRLMFRDILMLIARLRGAARTSVRGAGIQCDKHDGRGAP